MDGPYRDNLFTDWLPFLGDGQLVAWALSLLVLLPAGFFLSRLEPVSRSIGLLLGSLFFVCFIGIGVLNNSSETRLWPNTLIKATIFAGVLTACSWIVLPVIYPFLRFGRLIFIWLFEKPPHSRIHFWDPFRSFFAAVRQQFAGATRGRRDRALRSASDQQRRRHEAEWSSQQIYACEQEARHVLRELLDRSSPSPRPNAGTRLKWLQKAREKVGLDNADDPVALGEALERIDEEIRELEQQSEPSKQPEITDLPLLDAAISRHPGNAALYVERGNYYLNAAKDSHRALAEFKRSLALLPYYPAAHYALGMAYVDRQQFSKAAEHFGEALRLDPDFTNAQEKLTAIRDMRGTGLIAWIGRNIAHRPRD